jgi:gamma-aminobutyric acid type B receptor
VALSIVGAAIPFLIAVYVLIKRKTKLMKAAQPAFCLLFLFGAMLLNISLAFTTGPNDAGMCNVRPWLFNCGFTLAFAALFQKIFRVWKLFDNPRLKKVKVTNTMLMMNIAQMLFVEVLLMVIWSIADPITPTETTETDATAGDIVSTECLSNTQLGEFIPLLQGLWKVLLVLYGCFLAFKTRNVGSAFSESRHITIGIFAVAGIGGLILLVTVLLEGIPIKAKLIFMTIGVVIATAVATLVVFAPKIYVLVTQGDDAAISKFGSGGSQATTSTAMGDAQVAPAPPGWEEEKAQLELALKSAKAEAEAANKKLAETGTAK